MRKYRRSRKDYPAGVLAIYDNGGKTADRYTVVYEPYDIDGYGTEHRAFPVTDMSGAPFHPQGVCQHSEWTRRITATWGYEKAIPFAALPADCRRVVAQDLNPSRG